MLERKPQLITDLGTRRVGKKMKRFAIYACPECLNHYETQPYDVNSGNSKMCKSCSAIIRNKNKFGHIPSKLRQKFISIKSRCYNKNNNEYRNYGAKGIIVEWKNSEEFGLWAINNGYKKGLTIERKDASKNYCSNNCEWITSSENTRRMAIRKNYDRNKHIKISEDEASEICEAHATGLFTFVDISKIYNVYPSTIRRLIRKSYE